MATQRVQIPIAFQTESTVFAPLTSGGTNTAQTIMIPVPNAPVTVYNRLANGQPGTPATVYADGQSATQLSTITTDAGGNVPGYVVEGSYLVTAGSVTINGQVFSGATLAWDAVRGDGVENIFPGAVVSASIANGAVNIAQLATAVAQALLPVGAVVDFAGSAPPAGYLLCNGQSVTTATYPNLFAVIGYTYGGSGPNFNVPYFTGRVSLGATNAAPYTLGSMGGQLGHQHAIPSLAVNPMGIGALGVNPSTIPPLPIPQHVHSLSANGGAEVNLNLVNGATMMSWLNSGATFSWPSHVVWNVAYIPGATVDINTGYHGAGSGAGIALMGNTDKSASTYSTAQAATSATSTVPASTAGGTTQASATGANDQMYLAVNKIIKF